MLIMSEKGKLTNLRFTWFYQLRKCNKSHLHSDSSSDTDYGTDSANLFIAAVILLWTIDNNMLRRKIVKLTPDRYATQIPSSMIHNCIYSNQGGNSNSDFI